MRHLAFDAGPSLAWGAAAALAIVLLAVRVRRWWRSWRMRGRVRRAQRGERRAESLLRRCGYRIDERQASQTFAVLVDGEAHPVPLRADLLVSRRGRRYVAEVKTGRDAPRIDNVSTRRQLLEYLVAYDVDGVLLVTPETGKIHTIDFPGRVIPCRARCTGVLLYSGRCSRRFRAG